MNLVLYLMVGGDGVEPLAEAPDLQSFACYLQVTPPMYLVATDTLSLICFVSEPSCGSHEKQSKHYYSFSSTIHMYSLEPSSYNPTSSPYFASCLSKVEIMSSAYFVKPMSPELKKASCASSVLKVGTVRIFMSYFLLVSPEGLEPSKPPGLNRHRVPFRMRPRTHELVRERGLEPLRITPLRPKRSAAAITPLSHVILCLVETIISILTNNVNN